MSWDAMRKTKASVRIDICRTARVAALCSGLISGDTSRLAPRLEGLFFVHPDQIPLTAIWVATHVLLVWFLKINIKRRRIFE